MRIINTWCVLSVIVTIVLFACNPVPDNVKQTLDFAGSNRPELEKVIKHYRKSKDNLKLKAAYFLIGNMHDKYSYKSDFYNVYAKDTANLSLDDKIHIADSLIKVYNNSFNTKVYDCQVIKADYLIENIDLSFKAWRQQPWGKTISFDTFCEYILPYKIGNEPIENWRRDAWQQYNSLLDSVRIKKGSATDAAKIVNAAIKNKKFNFLFALQTVPQVGFGRLSKFFMGYCRDACDYTTYCLRAVGIPSGEDFVKQWANRSSSHVWNFIIDDKGKLRVFDGAYTNIGIHYIHTPYSKKGKVYRNTYSTVLKPEFNNYEGEVPEFFKDPHVLDVSGGYDNTIDVVLPWANNQEQFAYLCVFDNKEWVPVQCARYKDGKYVFKNMEPRIVYLPCYYKNNKVVPFYYPIALNKNRTLSVLYPSTQKQSISAFRKYFLTKYIGFFFRVIGGKFQGANKADFSDATDLDSIKNISYRLYEVLYPKSEARFRYVRYLSAKRGFGNLSELKLYSEKGMLTGKIIGIDCSYGGDPKKSIQSVFDGNTLTFYDACKPDSSWVGLDFGKKEHISQIHYAVRNDDNYIKPGNVYELYYHDWHGWVSLGKKQAETSCLDFDNVPKNALLLLHNHSGGTEERIFTYDYLKQYWW
jgi:hypothetical protein